MSGAFIVAYWIVAAVAFIDIVRRPSSDWAWADRSRANWIVLTIFLGPLGALAYAVVVLPKFAGSRSAVDDQFRKGPV